MSHGLQPRVSSPGLLPKGVKLTLPETVAMAEPAAGRQPTVSARPAATTLILLTLSAGFVDAVGYLLVVSVFTGFMSGATLGTGLSLGQAQWITAFHRVIPIPAFIIGLFIGLLLLES